MISLPPEPQNHWTLAWWISGVVTFIGLMWTAVVSGLTNWIKKAMWDRIFKKRQEQILTERERAVTNGEFDTFKVTTAGRMDELSRVTHAAAADMTDAAKETRETLRLFDLKSDEKTKEIFQRVNHTAEEVAALKQKVEDMPDVIVGRILQKVNFNPGKIED